MKRILSFVVAVALATTLTTSDAARAADPVLGAGSTFAEVALDQWAGDVNREQALTVDFSGIGSKGGLNQFQQGVVDFASSDVPYTEGDVVTRDFRYIPIVAGGTAVMYNLRGSGDVKIDNLQLSPETVAAIFFNEIKTWNDPRIIAENPHLETRLPALDIKRAVRTGGSGTTGVFTDFLSTVAPQAWASFVTRLNVQTQAGGNYTTDWPTTPVNGVECGCYAYAGSNEIAKKLTEQTPGANGTIGYAETAYAIQLGVPVAYIKNQAGFYRLPTARNVAVALLSATENGDGTQNLENVFLSDRPEAYPASSYNYLVIPTEGLSEGEGETLGAYVIYSVTQGQSKADILGYSPLPPNLVEYALNRVPDIDGAPAPPPLGDWGRFYEELEVDEEKPPTTNPNPDDGNPDDGNPDDGNPDDGNPDDGNPDDGNPDDGNPDDGNPDDGNPDDGNPDDDDDQGGQGNPTGTTRPGTTLPGAPTTSTTPCVTPTTTPSAPSSSTSSTAPPAATSTSLAPDAASSSSSSTAVTTTTNPCPPTTRPGAAAPRTSINSDGSVVTVESADQAETIGLRPGLRFNNETNELETIDGKKVPEVKGLGVGQLLGISAVIIGLLGLPPLLVGTGVFKRRSRART